VAEAFEREFDTVVQLLLRHPQLGTPGARLSRSLRLNGFPYQVHYHADLQRIRILAVTHHSRKPGYWHGRR
jgi:toxin ParE1/3/4